MSGSVTVPGTGTTTITVPQPTATSFNVAKQIADAIFAAGQAGKFSVLGTTIDGGSSSPSIPPTTGSSELAIYGAAAGSVLVPEGYEFVVNDSKAPVSVTATNASILTGTVGGAFFLTGGSGSIAAGGGDNVLGALNTTSFNLAAGDGNDTLDGLGGAGTLAGGGGSNLFYAGTTGGGVNVISTGSQDTVVALGGSVTVNSSGANELTYGTYSSLAGSISELVTGANATITAAASNLSATLAGSQALVFGGFNSQLGGATAGTLNVLDIGSNDTVSAGDSAATVTAGAGSNGLWVFGGTNSLNFIGGVNASTVVAGSGPASVAGSTGGLLFSGQSSTSTVTGGGGNVTLFGGSGVIDFSANAGGATVVSGAGNDTFNASGATNNLLVFGGSNSAGADVVIAGKGNDTLVAGKGSETFTGGGGSDKYFFVQSLGGGTNAVITDFSTLNGSVALFGYGQTTNQVLATATGGSSTTVTLSDNTKITFVGVSASSLSGHLISS